MFGLLKNFRALIKSKPHKDVWIDFQASGDMVYPILYWSHVNDNNDLEVKDVVEKIYTVCTFCLTSQTIRVLIPKILSYGISNGQVRVAQLASSVLEKYLSATDENVEDAYVDPVEVFRINPNGQQ